MSRRKTIQIVEERTWLSEAVPWQWIHVRTAEGATACKLLETDAKQFVAVVQQSRLLQGIAAEYAKQLYTALTGSTNSMVMHY